MENITEFSNNMLYNLHVLETTLSMTGMFLTSTEAEDFVIKALLT